jgi:RHS repeat-associated protein
VTQTLHNVNLATGKLRVPFVLATLAGQKGFGETLRVEYDGSQVLGGLQTLNEIAPTGVVGLGWNFVFAAIVRIGTGSLLDDQYMYNGQRLILTHMETEAQNRTALHFVTEQHTLLAIRFYPHTASEPVTADRWEVTDEEGTVHTYGGRADAVQTGIRWVSNREAPAVWFGESTEASGQQQIALGWYIARKRSISGQEVRYSYRQTYGMVGEYDKTKIEHFRRYTQEIYLDEIAVVGGERLSLVYADKQPFEYPGLRQSQSQNKVVNAFQDTVLTQYLRALVQYDQDDIPQRSVELDYGFLFDQASGDGAMQKRVLTTVVVKSLSGVAPGLSPQATLEASAHSAPVEPPHRFDYWGLRGDGYDFSQQDLRLLSSRDLFRPLAPYGGQLYGHLKQQLTPSGAVTTYFYAENNSRSMPVDDQNWRMRRELLALGQPRVQNSSPDDWQNPQVYWGDDEFAVVRWDNPRQNLVHFQLFDWVGGCWVAIPQTNELQWTWYVAGFESYQTQIVTGAGLFAFVRANVAEPRRGSVALFKRRPFVPGSWEFASLLPETKLLSGGTSLSSMQVGVGDGLGAVLDRELGLLYRFAHDGVRWQLSQVQLSGNSYASGMAMLVGGSSIFLFAADGGHTPPTTAHTRLLLYRYDVDAPAKQHGEAGWRTQIDQSWDEPLWERDFTFEEITLTTGDSFLLLLSRIRTDSHVYDLPLVVSWGDSATRFNIQRIHLSPGSWGIESKNYHLNFVSDLLSNLKSLIVGAPLPPQMALSLGSALFFAAPQVKQLFRYRGGASRPHGEQRENDGWFEFGTSNAYENEDPWAMAAGRDSTIEIELASFAKRRYHLLQYDALANLWRRQPSVQFQSERDAALLMDVVDFWLLLLSFVPILDEATLPLSFLSRYLGVASRLGLSGFKALAFTEAVSVADQVLQGFALGWLENQLYINHRSDTSMGQRYLLVGQEGQIPALYYKQWHPQELQWQWLPVGTVPLHSAHDAPGAQLTAKAFDRSFLRYVDQFAIYTFNDPHTNTPADRVLFLRNGRALPQAIDLPTDQDGGRYTTVLTADALYVNTAPWGGIFAYLPQSHSQPTIKYARQVALLMASDEAVTGPIADFVVSQVAVDDGYQTTSTYFQYLATNAAFNATLRSVVYNEVRVYEGLPPVLPDDDASEREHEEAAGARLDRLLGQNGWVSYFFYTDAPLAAEDPATSLQSPSNANVFKRLLVGEQYLKRVMAALPSAPPQELQRETIWWRVYELPLPGNPLRRRYGRAVVRQQTLLWSGDPAEEPVASATSYSYDLAALADPGDALTGEDTALLLSTTFENYALDPLARETRRELLRTSQRYAFEYYPALRNLRVLTAVAQGYEQHQVADDTAWQTISATAHTWIGEPGEPWRPYAQYRWRGTLDASFAPFGAWDSPQAVPGWLCEARITRAEQGVVIETEDAVGRPNAVLYDARRLQPVAQFYGVRLSDGMALYHGFEPYEDIGPWWRMVADPSAAQVVEADCYTGRRSLQVLTQAAWYGTTAIRAERLPERLVLSLFYKCSGAATLAVRWADAQGEPIQPLGQLELAPTDGNWAYQTLAFGTQGQTEMAGVFAITITAGDPSGVWIDDLRMFPVGAMATMQVYEPDTKLLSATIDANGLTTRFGYNQRGGLLSVSSGRGERNQGMSLQARYWSREGNADAFNPADPNSSLAIQPQRGFGANSPLPVHGQHEVVDQTLLLPAGDEIVYAVPDDWQLGMGVLLQIRGIYAEGAFQPLDLVDPGVVVDMSLAIDGHSPSAPPVELRVSRRVETGTFAYTLSGPGSRTVSVTGKAAPRDLLLLVVGRQVYAVIDGRRAAALVLGDWSASAAATSVRLRLEDTRGSGARALGLRQLMLFGDPVVSAEYQDGAGRVRQHELLVDIADENAGDLPRPVVRETLYNQFGLPERYTVPVAKQDALGLGFFQELVRQRNPFDAAGELWNQDTDALDGAISVLADQRFVGEDRRYAYSAHYYEPHPLRRLIAATRPGQTFARNGSHALRYQYGPLGREAMEFLSAKLGLLGARFVMQSSLQPLNDTQQRVASAVNDLLGRRVAELRQAPDKQTFLLRAYRYTYGPDEQDAAFAPTTLSVLSYPPNAFGDDVNLADWQEVQRFDALGRLVYTSSRYGGVQRYFYDDAGRMRFRQEALGVVTYFGYDRYGRLEHTDEVRYLPWDVAVLAEYMADPDAIGRQRILLVRRLQQYRYDSLSETGSVVNELGRMVRAEQAFGSDQAQVLAEYGHDEHGALTRVTEQVGDGPRFTTTYSYDLAGNVVAIEYPSDGDEAALTVCYAYNRQGLLRSVGTPTNLAAFAAYAYTSDGAIAAEQLGQLGQQRSYAYNTLGQLTSIADGQFEETLGYVDAQTQTYQDGNIQSALYRYLAPQQAALSHSYRYTYDSFGRLTDAELSVVDGAANPMAADGSRQYAYDPNGNIVMARAGTVEYRYWYRFNQYAGGMVMRDGEVSGVMATTNTTPDGLATTSYRSRRLFYDKLRRLSSVLGGDTQPLQEIVNDHRGERVQQTSPGQQLRYLRGSGTDTLMELVRDEHGAHARCYVYGPHGLIGIRRGDSDYFVSKDHLGSSRVLWDQHNQALAALSYLPYGEAVALPQNDPASAELLRYRFTGQEWDAATGLYNYHARMYDPELGRFYAPDPAAQFDSPYCYVGANPINRVDPDGRWARMIGRGALRVVSGRTLFFVVAGSGIVGSAVAGAYIGNWASDNGDSEVAGGIAGGVSGVLLGVASIGLAAAAVRMRRRLARGLRTDHVNPNDPLVLYTHTRAAGYTNSQDIAENLANWRGYDFSNIHEIEYDGSGPLGNGLPGNLQWRSSHIIYMAHGDRYGNFLRGHEEIFEASYFARALEQNATIAAGRRYQIELVTCYGGMRRDGSAAQLQHYLQQIPIQADISGANSRVSTNALGFTRVMFGNGEGNVQGALMMMGIGRESLEFLGGPAAYTRY